MNITIRMVFTAFCILFMNAANLSGENGIQIYHQSPTVIKQGRSVQLTFSVPGINQNKVSEAVLYYRFSGDIAYKQKQAVLNYSEFTVTLNLPDRQTGSLVYYFEIHYVNKKKLTWPFDLNLSGPARVEIIPGHKNADTESVQQSIGYTILSPQPGKTVTIKDALIAITLFYDEAAIDTSKVSFRLFLDGNDITDQADASNYFFTYAPEQIAPGTHTVSLQLVTEGEPSEEIASWEFVAEMAETETGPAEQAPVERFIQNGKIELRARNQVIAGNSNDVYSGNFRISSDRGNVRYAVYGRLTSQQDPRFQPQNRYGLELYAGNWLELRAGHFYPYLSPLTITGRRILGINTRLHFFNRALNVEFLYGNLNRSISNLYGLVQPQMQEFNNTIVDTTYFLNFEDNGKGTFQRQVIGGRLSFERSETFEIGINLLKIEDDTTSINVVKDYTDVVQMYPNSLDILSAADRQKLQNNPGLLNVNGNPTPKGNIVASSNLMFALDNSNIRFRGNVGMSLLNNDISEGVLDAETAADLGFILNDKTRNLLENLSWLIIINENMNSLPFKFNQDGEVNDFIPSGIFATNSELSLLYFDNSLTFQYRWVGPNFKSLANSTVRNDIAGFTITDRIQLLNNRIYITLGFEHLRNNVIKNRDATTNTNSFKGNVNWFPVKPELPRVSVGLMYRNRNNGVPLNNPFVVSEFENVAVNNFKEINGDAIIAANARSENTIQFNSSVSQRFDLFGINHTASLSYSLQKTTDDVFGFGDTQSSNISFNLLNHYQSLPLQTTIGVLYNNTETLSGLGTINIFGVNVGGSLFLLDDKLNIELAAAFTQNEATIVPLLVNDNGSLSDTADDYYAPNSGAKTVNNSQSYIFSASAQFDITVHHAIMLYSRITNISSEFESLEIPNDRILQARYIFSF